MSGRRARPRAPPRACRRFGGPGRPPATNRTRPARAATGPPAWCDFVRPWRYRGDDPLNGSLPFERSGAFTPRGGRHHPGRGRRSAPRPNTAAPSGGVRPHPHPRGARPGRRGQRPVRIVPTGSRRHIRGTRPFGPRPGVASRSGSDRVGGRARRAARAGGRGGRVRRGSGISAGRSRVPGRRSTRPAAGGPGPCVTKHTPCRPRGGTSPPCRGSGFRQVWNPCHHDPSRRGGSASESLVGQRNPIFQPHRFRPLAYTNWSSRGSVVHDARDLEPRRSRCDCRY